MKDTMVYGEGKPHQGSFDFHICPGHIMLFSHTCLVALDQSEAGIWGNSWEFEETSESNKQVPRPQILSRGEKLQACVFLSGNCR